jgi:bifunctional UDP-N-acetylglucosamine pyrophosphorylase/glucosamine-1-phosphate N-acetyltransferase
VLAAGEGRRMRSVLPKVLHTIGGATLLGHAVAAVAALSPAHLAVVIGHGREQVRDEVAALGERLGRAVVTATQERQLGTGHAVRCGLDALPPGLTGPVLVTYGDVPLLAPATLAGLLAEHVATGAAVSLITGEPTDPTGYGRVVRDAGGAVQCIVEHADATSEQRAIAEVNSGVYAFDAAFLAAELGRLSSANTQGELYLTDLVAAAVAQGHPVRAVPCHDTWQVQGVNDRLQLADVRAELNRRVLRRWMLAGVTVVDPGTTWVDVGVSLGRDVVLHPGTQLHGSTSVDDGAEIGPDTTLTDCAVGGHAHVVRTHGSASEIGPGASVGPFAYLRPGARLGARGKIGTFVEVKNSDIGEGSKVPHLTYVGDATIGEESNIGAASVFVNYDGVRKQRTVVGSHVRTGSDTMFIAPLHVGDGAYTGAGTVLRHDVPAGALAVSAGSQRIIEGWVEKNRPGTPAAEAAGRYRSGTPDPEHAPDDGRGGPRR